MVFHAPFVLQGPSQAVVEEEVERADRKPGIVPEVQDSPPDSHTAASLVIGSTKQTNPRAPASMLIPGPLSPRAVKAAFAVGDDVAAEPLVARDAPSETPEPEPIPVPDLLSAVDEVEVYVSPEELIRGQYCDALAASVRQTEKRLARWTPGTAEWFKAKAEAVECEVSRSVCMGLLATEVDKQRFDVEALKISAQVRDVANTTSQALTLEMQHLRRAGRAGLAHRVASQMESAASAAELTDKGRLRCWGWVQAICRTLLADPDADADRKHVNSFRSELAVLAKIREAQNAPRLPGQVSSANGWSAVQNLVGARLKVQLKEISFEGNKAIAKLQRWVHEAVMASELDAPEASEVSTVLGNVSGGIERFMKGSKKTPEFKKAAKKHLKRCKQRARAYQEGSGKLRRADAAPTRRPLPPAPMRAAPPNAVAPSPVPSGTTTALMPNRSRAAPPRVKLAAMAKLYAAGPAPSKLRVLLTKPKASKGLPKPPKPSSARNAVAPMAAMAGEIPPWREDPERKSGWA